ncbi:SRP19 family protein [Lyngbya aestuarii BL J]|uniref:SRP19 family protein n=1 Tax=Lyngbya aestuarii BL J TaxID=1348334 RepID=U7QKG1_9CYAN|nr:tetratricopeptide repeat protein [Lyngbya aestuarii]ERT07777.1 SRP19 family protein [Lyngbya aestuarii BL J]
MDEAYTQKIKELLEIGRDKYNEGDWENSIASFSELYQLSNRAKDWVYVSFAAAWLGCAYWKKGDFDSAQNYFQERFNWAQVLDDFSAKWEVLNWMAELAEKQENLEEAIDYYQGQLILVRLQNISADFEIKIVDRIGRLYFSRKNYALAIDYLRRSLILAEELSWEKWRASNLYILADCYRFLENWAGAADYYREAATVYRTAEETEQWALKAWENVKQVCREMGDLTGAIAAEENRLEVFRQREDRSNQFFSLYGLGSLFWESREYSRAREYFLLALKMGKQLHAEATEEAQQLIWAKNQMGNAEYMLGRVEEAMGRVEEAVGSYGRAMEFYQQANNQEWVGFSQQKWEQLKGRWLASQGQGYLDFLVEVLEAVRNSKGNAETVYSLLEANLDKLDDGFILALRTYIEGTLSKLESAQKGFISQVIFDFISLIQDFPQGSKVTNIEIAIAGYEAMETIFTRESDPKNWAAIQNNLGLAYRNRIRDDKAENIEKAIAAYNLALEVYTKKDFPLWWAATQYNLGGAYRNRIRDDKAENIEKAIAAYNLALEVYTKKDFPKNWATTQNNLGIAYSERIRDNKAENIEKAIHAYQLALSVRTREDFPIEWAETQNNLGNAYLDRIRDDKAENIENAIAAHQQALSVYTKKDFPTQWATTQNNLGNAYLYRIRDDKAKNIENAIAAYKLALEIRTREAFPVDWAMTQNNLGLAYCDRILGDKAENIENAIATYNLALEVYTKEDFPMNWAGTKSNLGGAYLYRIRDDKAKNIEKAIATYNLALEVYTKEDFPIEWAMTQNNLGTAYGDRIRNDKAENIEKAIAAYKLALSVSTREDYPVDWAATQNNLGNAYSYRILGDKAENIEKAIATYNLALEVYTKEDFPIEWAMTQNNLGTAYGDRIRNDKAENIEKAIATYNLALEVYTREDYPVDWAATQNNLGNAYLYRIRDNKAENIEEAIHAYQQALLVYTLEADPIQCLRTSSNLGYLHFTQGKWQPAIAVYQQAITAVELIRSLSQDDDRRQKIIEEAIDVYMNIVQCFVNLQQYEKAVEYAERSRSRMIAELMASKDLYPNAEIPAQLLEKYYGLQQRLSHLRRSNSDDSNKQLATAKNWVDRRDSGEVEKQNLAEIEQVEKERQRLWREIRKSDPILAGQLQVDPLSIDQMRALIKDEETAILSFYTTNDDTYIFIVGRQNVQLFTCEGQGIKALHYWIFDNWLEPYIDYRNKENLEWRNNMGEFLQQLAQRLQLNQLINQHLSGIKELIIVPHLFLHQIPFAALPVNISPPPLNKGGYEDSVFPLNKGGNLDPVSPFLRGTEGGSTRATEGGSTRGTEGGSTRGFEESRLSIPSKKKTTPSPATKKPQTPQTQPTYLSDIFRLRVVPSCQILNYCDSRNKNTNSPQMGIVENATGDLIFTGYECQNLAQMFQVPKDFRLQYQQATVSNYHELTKQVQFLHSSHHASANLINPMESKLHLFDGEVTLGDVFTWRLPKLTDVFLSCCETNLTVSKLNDDILTIAAGFLSAGAQSVVSTLWAVNDFATALFCLFYYQHRQNPNYTRPQALYQAQIDLRNLTGRGLNDKYKSQLSAHLQKIKTEENQSQIQEMSVHLAWLCQQDYPFINPYYWAGFVSQGLQ